jgi:hypothetical protein
MSQNAQNNSDDDEDLDLGNVFPASYGPPCTKPSKPNMHDLSDPRKNVEKLLRRLLSSNTHVVMERSCQFNSSIVILSG